MENKTSYTLQDADNARINDWALNYALNQQPTNTGIERIEQDAFKNGCIAEHKFQDKATEELRKENASLKIRIEGLLPKSDLSKAIDPDGYATAAAKILHALNLAIGVDVNEWAMPTIVQIIKNNVTDLEIERLTQSNKELVEALNITACASISVPRSGQKLNALKKSQAELWSKLSQIALDYTIGTQGMDTIGFEEEAKKQGFAIKRKDS